MFPIRDENKSGSFPVVSVLLIVACTAIFLYEASLGRSGLKNFFDTFALTPGHVSYDLRSGEGRWLDIVAPFFTSMFLHGVWLHLLGNMWYLWIFGDNVEDTLGPIRFILFYLLCGLAAGLTHYMLGPTSSLPTLGASGAIAGVLGGYVALFPRARILTLVPLGFFIRFVDMPALVMIGIWFLLQILSSALTIGGASETGGVAWSAHVGGFAAGLILIWVFRPRRVMV